MPIIRPNELPSNPEPVCLPDVYATAISELIRQNWNPNTNSSSVYIGVITDAIRQLNYKNPQITPDKLRQFIIQDFEEAGWNVFCDPNGSDGPSLDPHDSGPPYFTFSKPAPTGPTKRIYKR